MEDKQNKGIPKNLNFATDESSECYHLTCEGSLGEPVNAFITHLEDGRYVVNIKNDYATVLTLVGTDIRVWDYWGWGD